MERDVLIFWFAQPPKVERGAYNEVASLWGKTTLYISLGDWSTERKNLKWDDQNFGCAQMIKLDRSQDITGQVEHIFDEYPTAINVIPGFTSQISNVVCKFAFERNSKLCVLTERPNMFGNALIRIIRKLYVGVKYRKIYKKFDSHVDVLLPLGKKAVEEYASTGWQHNKMFPFMYCPEAETFTSQLVDYSNKSIKFLYIGRFMYSTKGLDVMTKALDQVRGNWSIDFVGGYGKDQDSMMKWIDNCPNAQYLGVWESNSVISRISNYDAVIVPSKYEGWNMIVYEAIMAGIGVITTDEATSDEIISSSKAGIVVKSYNVNELRSAIQSVIDDPEILNRWREKAKLFQSRLLPKTVAQYFIDIMDWKYYKKSERPKCPWII